MESFKVIKLVEDFNAHVFLYRLLSSPIYMEADERTTAAAISVSGYLQLTTFNLSEYLYDANKVEEIPLLTFKDINTTNKATIDGCKPVKTSVILDFKHIARTISSVRNSGPKTDLKYKFYVCIL